MKNGIDYVRRADLELRNNGMIILDINMKSKYRLINLYRSFNPTDGRSQRDFFVNQLLMIKAALVRSEDRIPIVLGDFNLEENLSCYICYYKYHCNSIYHCPVHNKAC